MTGTLGSCVLVVLVSVSAFGHLQVQVLLTANVRMVLLHLAAVHAQLVYLHLRRSIMGCTQHPVQ